MLEEIPSPFQWCKAFRANSILPEYNGGNPSEGQSVLGIISPSICSNCSLMPPDTALIFLTLFLLLPQHTGYCRDSARASKIPVILLQLCTNVCSLWVGETVHAFTGYVLYHIHLFVRDLCPLVLSSSLVCVLKHPHFLKYVISPRLLHLMGHKTNI